MRWEYVYVSDISDLEYRYWYSLMSEEKKDRVRRYRCKSDKKRTIAGEMIIRKMISEQYNLSQQNILIETGKYGKPEIKNIDTHFNISHSEDMVVGCIGARPIGIDVEKIKKISTSILRKTCTTEDIEYIVGSDTNGEMPKTFEANHLRRFYEVWTAKEAYFKCVGTGIGIQNLKSVSIDMLSCNITSYSISGYIISIVQTPFSG